MFFLASALAELWHFWCYFQVKQIMEEAVTRKFVHEESSSITSLCGQFSTLFRLLYWAALFLVQFVLSLANAQSLVLLPLKTLGFSYNALASCSYWILCTKLCEQPSTYYAVVVLDSQEANLDYLILIGIKSFLGFSSVWNINVNFLM